MTIASSFMSTLTTLASLAASLPRTSLVVMPASCSSTTSPVVDGEVAAVLTKRERKDLDAGIKEFNLKRHVFDRPLLPDELIHPRLSNLAAAIGAGIGSVIGLGCGTNQLDLEANWRSILRGPQNHVEVAAVEPEHNLAGRRLECPALGTDLPQSAESPLIECGPRR